MTPNNYTLMPFSFEVLPEGDYFISGMTGDFAFINESDFRTLVLNNLPNNSNVFNELESKNIISTGIKATEALTASCLLSKKAFTFSGPRLHIVVVTRGCNCHCDYCHASSYSPGQIAPQMTIEDAAKTARIIMSSPSNELTIEFQGGEPTLAWDIICFMVDYIRILNIKAKKSICFVLCTNLLFLNTKMINYIKSRGIEISTSLDGPKYLHDSHRHIQNGSAHDSFIKNLLLLESKIGKKSSPLLTVTKSNLRYLREVIDYYIKYERNGIFIRELNHFGRAKIDETLSYSADEFIESYIDALEYILEINLNGNSFREFMVSLFLKRIYTSFDDGFVDLKFPAGAGLSVLVYDYDGMVYPSDEARMMAASGDKSLVMGDIHSMSGEDIRNSSIAKKILETSIPSLIPGCTHCPYVLYCGVDPIKVFSETGDFMLFSESSECKKNKAIFRWLFRKIRNADENMKRVLFSWIT